MEMVIFCIVFFIDVVRYIINALFSFNTYVPINKNINIKNHIIKRSCECIVFYTLILSTLKYIIDGPAIPFISTLLLFIWFWIDNKDLKQWQFPLTFSFFISSVIECTHTFSYKAVQFIMGLFNITDTSEDHIYDKDLLFWRVMVTLVYFVLLFLIYKLKIIKIKTIKQISNYILVPVFLAIVLTAVIYIKHNIKTSDDKFRNILSNTSLFFPIILLCSVSTMNKYISKINNMKNQLKKIKINTALEDAKNRKGKGPDGLYFTVEKHKLEMEYFEKMLEKFGMKLGVTGKKQTAFAAVLLKQYDNFKDVELNKNIFMPISDIVDITPKGVYRNIEYFIEINFNTFKPGEMEKFYKGPISKKKSLPTPSQLLLYMVQKCKEEEINDKDDNL